LIDTLFALEKFVLLWNNNTLNKLHESQAGDRFQIVLYELINGLRVAGFSLDKRQGRQHTLGIEVISAFGPASTASNTTSRGQE
jgi:hypothetical protein